MRFFSVWLLTFLFITGCDLYGKIGTDDTNIEGALPALLKGEWVYTPPGSSSPERYVIEENTLQYGYGGESVYDYKGDIRFVSNYSTDSGVIIIEYTVRPTYQKYNGKPFFGIYYRNLKSNTVQLANPINLADSYSAPDTDTLEEAIKKFTRNRMGSLVGWGNVQPQTRVR
jgi:hypothetical protein